MGDWKVNDGWMDQVSSLTGVGDVKHWIVGLNPCGIYLLSPLPQNRSRKQENFTTPATSQLSLPVNDDRCLHALLSYLLCCDVVPQSVEGPADEGRLLIKAGPRGGQALGRRPQESGPQSIPQRLSQSGLTCDGKREGGKSHLANREGTLGTFSENKR